MKPSKEDRQAPRIKANVFELSLQDIHQLMQAFAVAGINPSDIQWLCQGANAGVIKDHIQDERKQDEIGRSLNPFEVSARDQINRLKEAAEHQGWKIPQEDINRLRQTAPAWPRGKTKFRSLRIRFGEGSEGVQKTFRAHELELKRSLVTLGKQLDHKENQHMLVKLIAGDKTHKPCIEWISIDLAAYHKNDHRSLNQIATQDGRCLADEMLVLSWMFPHIYLAKRENTSLFRPSPYTLESLWEYQNFLLGGYQARWGAEESYWGHAIAIDGYGERGVRLSLGWHPHETGNSLRAYIPALINESSGKD